MLKNSELKDISYAISMLTAIKIYAINQDSSEFYDNTGITIIDIERQIKALEKIHLNTTLQKKKCSEQANKWNKTHIERHREINKNYERRKKGVK